MWMEVMRDAMIYFRNNQSILFAGRRATIASVSPEHLQQMVDLPGRNGIRMAGVRDGLPARSNDSGATPIAADIFGVMIGQDNAH